MEEIAISKFKATCLSVLEGVRRSRRPILVTRFGKPVAQIVPPPPPKRKGSPLGCMRGSAKIIGDIISPAFDESEFDALR